MADRVSKEVRSRMMSGIRQSHTGPELRLRLALRKNKVGGWRSCPRHILGKPDLVFSKSKLAIFVDGCFWHGCSKCCKTSKSNLTYWRTKVQRNQARDRRIDRELRKRGWTVVHIWEHSLRKSVDIARCVKRINSAL